MDPSILIAAGIVGTLGAGLGLTYALRKTAIQRFQQQGISSMNALPVLPASWKEVLAWAHRFGRSQVTFGNEVGVYQHFFELLPSDFPHWTTLDLAVGEFHTQAYLHDSRYKEFNIRKAMDGLARSALLTGRGGSNVLIYCMRRELSAGGRFYTPAHLERHPGYAGMVEYALVHRSVSMDWGTSFQSSTGQLILQLMRRYYTSPEEALTLLVRMRDPYRKIYPQLFVEGANKSVVLTRMFFSLPAKLLAEIYGKEFERIFADALRFPVADENAGMACKADIARPVFHLGYAACPICWNPLNLEHGVRCISGVIGEAYSIPTDERTIPIPYPLNLNDLPSVEKLILGQVPGVEMDALVDQALVFADRLPTPVEIQLTDSLQPSSRLKLMVQEHNARIMATRHV